MNLKDIYALGDKVSEINQKSHHMHGTHHIGILSTKKNLAIMRDLVKSQLVWRDESDVLPHMIYGFPIYDVETVTDTSGYRVNIMRHDLPGWRDGLVDSFTIAKFNMRKQIVECIGFYDIKN